MYEKTITLFNHYVNGTTDEWRATVLHNVDLIVDRSVIVGRYGAESKDKGVLHIRYSGNEIEDHTYFDPKDYNGQGITFQTGEKFDFILDGVWSGSATVSDSAYANGFYDHMNRNERVFSLSTVTKYTLIPHFEITVK